MKKLYSLSIALFLGSCTILPEIQPVAIHDFGFTFYKPGNSDLAPTQVSVEAPEWLADTRIRYRLLYAEPTQVRYYSLDQWIAPPNELFEQLLSTHTSGLPKLLAIQIQGFEQQFDAPGRAKALMRFSAVASSENSGDKLLKKDFVLQQPCPTADAKGAVTGFSILARNAVDQIQLWLKEIK